MPDPTPDPAVLSDARALNTDDARLALWQAIGAIKIGNPTDDKLIVAELAKQGVYLARFATPPASDAAVPAGVDAPQGTFACPICGKDTPHYHRPEEVERHREVEAWVEESWQQARVLFFPDAAAAPKVASDTGAGLERVKLVASALCCAAGMDPDGGARSGYGWRDHEAAAIELLAALATDATGTSETAALREALEAWRDAQQATDDAVEHMERAIAEGWYTEPGGASHIADSDRGADAAWAKAIALRDAALTRWVETALYATTTPGGDLLEQAAREVDNYLMTQTNLAVEKIVEAVSLVRALSARNLTEGGEG